MDIIFVQAVSGDVVPQAANEISEILRTRHRTPVGEDDFTVFTQQDLLSTFQSITGILTIFLGGIAGISLLVGGIGIMNIMLPTVTERTREIGIRRALGARRRDITSQFLVETTVLSLNEKIEKWKDSGQRQDRAAIIRTLEEMILTYQPNRSDPNRIKEG